jgi:hypothetical protein
MNPFTRPAVTLLVALVCLSASHIAVAAVEWVPVSEAEKSMEANPLDPGAGAVVLFKRGEMRLDERTAGFWLTTIETYVRIKVFNESGLKAADVSFEASRYRRFKGVEGRTILPDGKVIPLDATKVFSGKSYETGSGAVYMKTSFALPGVEPGAILEYRITQTSDGFFPPVWYFDTEELGTLESTLSVLVAPRLALAQYRMDTAFAKIDAKQTRVANGNRFDYVVRNLQPIKSEPFSIPFADQACVMLFSPFEVAFGNDSYPMLQKWNDVAREYDSWYKESLKKSKSTKDKAKEIAAKFTDEREKAQAIYNFIQQTIASTEFSGVGYIRPPDEVLADKRGDPDEINAMYITMLREVKIDADPVLIASRNKMSLNPQFPNMVQFTGLTTRIRLKNAPSKDPKDPNSYVISDPSDPAVPFGEVAWYNQGILGVAVNGSKAENAAIPLLAAENNAIETKLVSELLDDGAVEAKIESLFRGADARRFRRRFQDEPADKLEQALWDFLDMGLPESEFSETIHSDFKDTTKPATLATSLRYQLLDESEPGQLLLNPWLADRGNTPEFTATERKSAVRFDFPKTRITSSTWHLPENMTVEELPKDVSIKSDLGEFSRSCAEKDGDVVCERKFVLSKLDLQNFAEYMQAKQLFEQVAKHDQEVIVLNME